MRIKSVLIIFIIGIFVSLVSAQGGPSREELEMAARSPEYRAVAEQFVAAAAAHDAGKLERMLSPAAAARAGKEAMQKVLNGQVIPFFADHKEIGRSVTTTTPPTRAAIPASPIICTPWRNQEHKSRLSSMWLRRTGRKS